MFQNMSVYQFLWKSATRWCTWTPCE